MSQFDVTEQISIASTEISSMTRKAILYFCFFLLIGGIVVDLIATTLIDNYLISMFLSVENFIIHISVITGICFLLSILTTMGFKAVVAKYVIKNYGQMIAKEPNSYRSKILDSKNTGLITKEIQKLNGKSYSEMNEAEKELTLIAAGKQFVEVSWLFNARTLKDIYNAKGNQYFYNALNKSNKTIKLSDYSLRRFINMTLKKQAILED